MVKCDPEQIDVVIIGGGLAGLGLADLLHRAGRSFVLLEARDRLGGRIKSCFRDDHAFDMGPAWFWPGQPRMAEMVRRLSLRQFNQYSDGSLSMEDERGHVHRGQGYASMEGSYRVAGGLTAVIDGLAAVLPKDAVRMGHAVESVVKTSGGVVVSTVCGSVVSARQIVLALPPRKAAELRFEPALDGDILETMQAVPTWMAGQAKAVAVYDTPFWREEGLSGDAMSRHGPMVEIHDASPADGDCGALFGFIGVPAHARTDEAVLRDHILAQLGRLFGEAATTPDRLFIKDWATDANTATDRDRAPMYAHPTYGLPPNFVGIWDARIIFGGTEVAKGFGGYLEGALEAAEHAYSVLQRSRVSP